MSQALLQVRGLTVTLAARRGGKRKLLQAVRGIDLDIDHRETLGLVGESGSGKSTTGRAILGLQMPTSGSISFEGRKVAGAESAQHHKAGQIQAVYQNPYAALDPTKTIGDSIAEPLHMQPELSEQECRRKVRELLEMVSLPSKLENAYSRELSGGQRQRVNIARAIATRPKLIVLDEPLSSLDISTQSHIFNLLESLRRALGMSYLFIAHDLAMVHHASARIAVMYLGGIVESGDAELVYRSPLHPYTQALVTSVPIADPAKQLQRRQARRQLLAGDLPSPFSSPIGCAYHPRCPFAFDRCKVETPALQVQEDGRKVACHLHRVEMPKRGPQLIF